MEKPRVFRITLEDKKVGEAGGTTPVQAHNGDSESLVYQRVRRQVLHHGLARHRGEASTKESHQRARLTRLERQIAIVEKFNRDKARQEARLKINEPCMLNNTPANVIIPQQAPQFSRKVSLRQLSASPEHTHSNNQLEEGEQKTRTGTLSSPTVLDIENFAILAAQPVNAATNGTQERVPSHEPTSKTKSGPAVRTHLDKSTAQVLCELKITKDIMMREHLVKQIHETAAILNQLGGELFDLAQRKPRFDGSSGNVLSGSLSRHPSSSVTGPATSPVSLTKSQQKNGELSSLGSFDPSRGDNGVPDWEAKNSNLIHKAQQRMAQLHRLTASVQTTTMDLVESILEWRARKTNPSAISNIQKIHRFAWKKCNISNYLIHIDSDLRDLFPSPSMSVLLGTNAKYNPLLLPRAALDTLGIPDDSFVSTTFLTDRREGQQSTPNDANGPPSPTRRQAFVALHNAVKSVELASTIMTTQSQMDPDRVRASLEAIQQEQVLERQALEALTVEKQRMESAYNPFESIKLAGGVEDAIATAFSQQEEAETVKRAEQLRRRQEDTSRVKDSPLGSDSGNESSANRAHPLFVNPGRIRRLIEQRKEVREAATECELHDTTAAWKKNKLRGQVMVRKMNIRRMENMHARKIQRQFLVYRRRTQLLRNLAHFVVTSRHRIISIQKVVRGFIAKKRYQEAKHQREVQRLRQVAAKIIWYAYKRYKRRLRHRHSMSVEAVAQIQLLHVIQHQLEDATDESSSAERYRKVGEERRRQRAVHLYKRRQELLELEAKRAAAAVRIQSICRMHLARKTAMTLRGERRAHMSAVSAMMIQSKIRKFLKHQEKRRQRFRSDMERVNRCAVRIQSIYRGYNSRASLMDELSELAQRSEPLYGAGSAVEEDFDDEEDEVFQHGHEGASDDGLKPDQERSYTVLPPIVNSRPSTAASTKAPSELNDLHAEEEEDMGDTPTESLHVMVARTSAPSPPKLSLPPIRPRAQSVQTSGPTSVQRKAQPPPVRRQLSNGTMKVELKLKETTLGDDLDESSASASSGGFLGPFRRRLSGSNGSFRRNSVDSVSSSGSFRGNIPTH